MMKNNLPKIRFSSYFDAWEQRELKEIAELTMGQSPSGENYTDNPEDYILVQGNADIKNGLVVPRVWTKQVTKLAKRGDIIISVRAPVGELGKTDYDVVLGRGVAGIKGNEFVYQKLIQLKEKAYWKKLSTGSTFDSINSNDLKGALISLPKEEEQQKIGEFFKQLDYRIALQQRHVEQLKQSKQGFLQKMFPKDGESVPEVRFAGFHGEWIEKEIGHFLQESRIKGSNGLDAKKLTVKLWGKGIVEKNSDFKGSIATQYYKRRAGQFMYGKLDFLHQAFGIVPDYLDGFESTLDSPAFDLSDDINANFLLEYVSREKFYVYFGTIANGSRKAKRIHVDTFLKMPIHVPQFQEQQKIGEFFKQLDDRIALQQNHIEQLKQSKQGFLQKMFPKDGESVPEVRFEGFSEEWGYYKLGDMKDVRDGTHESPKYQLEGRPLVTSKNLKDNGLDLNEVSLISNLDFEAINRRSKVNVGDILFGMIGTVGNPVLIERDDFAIKNVALIKENEKVKNQFLNQLLKSPVFDKYIQREIAGNTQKFLGLSKIRNFQLHIPIVEEQQKIGDFFKQLDDLIAKNERELELLQETKKGFLQKMFV